MVANLGNRYGILSCSATVSNKSNPLNHSFPPKNILVASDGKIAPFFNLRLKTQPFGLKP